MNLKFFSYSFFILNIFIFNSTIDCFFPSSFFDDIIYKFESSFKFHFDEISKTFSHEEILKRGLMKSVTKYFYDQPDGSNRINMSKINDEYLNIENLFEDYYGKKYCPSEFSKILKQTLYFNVARVDLNSDTKKMPYAHFDSEKFKGSNERVLSFNKQIYELIEYKDYSKALLLIGQVLHTIHDFYSHSNWVEMGYKTEINRQVGTEKFSSETFIDQNEPACVSNCSLIEINCSQFVIKLSSLIKRFGYKSLKCPLRYFKCDKNIIKLNKLISGYSVNQKLPDGTSIEKPLNANKCSHAGILDESAFKNAQGGINKDSGFYLFSPHADLHLTAANLAIKHTEYYFEQIRAKIGNEIYSELFGLKIKGGLLNRLKKIAFC